MKRLFLMLAAAASVAAAAPLAAPALARDGGQGHGQGRSAQKHERGGPPADRGGGARRYEGGDRGGDRAGPRYQPQRAYPGDRGGPRRSEDDRGGPRYIPEDRPRSRVPALGYGDRRRDEDRPRYEERPRYDERPRYGDSAPPRARGFAAPPPNARRGGYLPRNFSGEIVDDYRRYRLRTPPAGFAWVRMGNGFALVSMADGQIFDMVQ